MLSVRRFASGKAAKAATASASSAAPSPSLGALLSERVDRYRFGKGLVRYGGIEDGSWTFDEFSKLVSEHAIGLLDAKFRPHDSMVLHLGEFELEGVVSFLAAALASLSVSTAGAGSSVGATLAGARGAVVAREHLRAYYNAIRELETTPYGEAYRFSEYPELKMLLQTGREPVPGFYTYESTFVTGATPNPLKNLATTGNSELAYSLGADGKKKSFSHAALIQAATKFGDDLALGFQDRVLVAVPQNKLYGMACGIVPCITHASLFVLDGPTFDAERQVALMEAEQANVVVATPTLLQKLLAVPGMRKAAENVNKLAVVVDQSSALEKQQAEAALGQAKIAFPKLAVTVVASVDDRTAIGPINSKVKGKD